MIKDKAFDYARSKHEGQKGAFGRDYFSTHCVKVASILELLVGDDDIICAALLHDTIEDTDTSYDELVTEFGQEIATIVLMVTNDNGEDHFPRLQADKYNELYHKAVIVKFADRLANISRKFRDDDDWSDERIYRYLSKSRFWDI